MYYNLFRITLLSTAIAIILAACGASIPTTAPTVPTEEPTAVSTLPFAHTACAEGVDLTGQTINLYQIVEETEPMLQPMLAGYEDATAYFNAHGGICGALSSRFIATRIQDITRRPSMMTSLHAIPNQC
jgi:hypothetical protein